MPAVGNEDREAIVKATLELTKEEEEKVKKPGQQTIKIILIEVEVCFHPLPKNMRTQAS